MGNPGKVTIIYDGKKIYLHTHWDGTPNSLGSRLAIQLKKILIALSKNPISGIKKLIEDEKNIKKPISMYDIKDTMNSMIAKGQDLQDILAVSFAMFHYGNQEAEEEEEEKKEMEEHIEYPKDILITLKNHIKELKIVHYDSPPPTLEEQQLLKPFSDTSVSSQKLDEWYVLLRRCQGDLLKTFESGYVLSNEECDYDTGYTINLDTNEFYCENELVSLVTSLSETWYITYYEMCEKEEDEEDEEEEEEEEDEDMEDVTENFNPEESIFHFVNTT